MPQAPGLDRRSRKSTHEEYIHSLTINIDQEEEPIFKKNIFLKKKGGRGGGEVNSLVSTEGY